VAPRVRVGGEGPERGAGGLVTRAVIAESVRILRRSPLLAESLAWQAYMAGLPLKAAQYDREADRLWERSEEVARAEVQPC